MSNFDWERHFRAMKAAGPRPTFGTVGGAHTVAELQDLLAAKDVEVARLDAAIQKILNQGPPTEKVATWKTWYDAFKIRYGEARQKAQDAIGGWALNPFVPANMAPVEGEYVGVLKALSQAYPEMRTVEGDLVDLSQKLTALGGQIEQGPIPQPRPDSDVEFTALQATNAITHAAEHTLQSLTPSKITIFLVAVGLGVGLFLLPKLLVPAPLRLLVR